MARVNDDVERLLLEFADLPGPPAFEREIAATPIRNTNERWRDGLTVAQQRILDGLLHEDLLRYGYEVSRLGEDIPRSVTR